MIRAIVDHWDRLRGERRIPAKTDFDPLAIPRHLPGVLLIQVEGLDENGVGIYRYRVVGSNEVENRGHNPTGKLVDEGFFYSSLEGAKAEYENVRRNRTCSYNPSDFLTEDFRPVRELSVLLPFGDSDDVVTHILVYSERKDAD